MMPQDRQRGGHAACARAWAVACLLGGWGGLPAWGAGVAAGTPQATVDGAMIPVTFYTSPGERIASLQFQLRYDTRNFTLVSAQAGPAAASAGKDVAISEQRGGATIIVAGFNQSEMQGGLVAAVYLDALGSEPLPGNIAVASAVFSDPGGNPVDSKGVPGKNPDRPDYDPSPDPAEGEAPEPVPVDEPVDEPVDGLPGSNFVNPAYGAPDPDTLFEEEDTGGALGNTAANAQEAVRQNAAGGGVGVPASGVPPLPGAGGGVVPGAEGTDGGASGFSAAAPSGTGNGRQPSGGAGGLAGTSDSASGPAAHSIPRGAETTGAFPGPLAATYRGEGTAPRPGEAGWVAEAARAGGVARPAAQGTAAVPLLAGLMLGTGFVCGAWFWRQKAAPARRRR